MTVMTFLIGISTVYLPFAVAVPESLTLLGFGIGLIGATAVLRRVLKRRDENIEEKNETAGKVS